MYAISIILTCVLTLVDASLYDFIYVGQCILGFNPWLELLKHGCYCGFGNHGNVRAEDDYDQCCLEHDKCYDDLVKISKKCPSTLFEYISPYKYECTEDCDVICSVPFPFNILPGFDTCGQALCGCDAKMMKCWRNVQWGPVNYGLRPDKKNCTAPNATHEWHSGIPTWFDKFQALMAFENNVERSRLLTALRENKIVEKVDNVADLLPEAKCKKYANIPQHSNEIAFPPQKPKGDIGNGISDIISFH